MVVFFHKIGVLVRFVPQRMIDVSTMIELVVLWAIQTCHIISTTTNFLLIRSFLNFKLMFLFHVVHYIYTYKIYIICFKYIFITNYKHLICPFNLQYKMQYYIGTNDPKENILPNLTLLMINDLFHLINDSPNIFILFYYEYMSKLYNFDFQINSWFNMCICPYNGDMKNQHK